MAYSMSFREKDRTLEEREVQIIVNRIIESLEKKFNAELRS
jgi:phenylalanyl-tRNA synthetase beta subunit